VFATMRDPGKSAKLQDALTAAGARNQVEIIRLDVNDAASVRDAVASTLASTGGVLDAVVHNAGVAVGGAFEDVPEATQRAVMETNFFGVLTLTRALLPTFRAQRRGRIVVVSSNSAYAGEPANAIYVASKWAVEGWAESLAYEVGPFGIEIVLIEPGSYRTEIWDSTPRLVPENTAYRPLLEPLERAIDEKVMATARDPREVGVTIANALEARRPHFRYPVGPDARLGHFMRGKVPTRVQRFAITRYLGLHRVVV